MQYAHAECTRACNVRMRMQHAIYACACSMQYAHAHAHAGEAALGFRVDDDLDGHRAVAAAVDVEHHSEPLAVEGVVGELEDLCQSINPSIKVVDARW